MAIRAQSRIDLVEHSRSGLCRQKIHQATHQASEKHRVVQRLRAVRLLARSGRVVQEHEVEVRSIGQFESTELAVTNDAKTGFASIATGRDHRLAVQLCHVSPGDLQRTAQYRFRNVGQAVADTHDWQATVEVRDSNAELTGALKSRQEFDLRLTVIDDDPCQSPFKLRLEAFARDCLSVNTWIQQFIKQHRITCNLLRYVRTSPAKTDQSRHRLRVLIQQRQVSTASQHLLCDQQHSMHDKLRISGVFEQCQQIRHELPQSLPRNGVDMNCRCLECNDRLCEFAGVA